MSDEKMVSASEIARRTGIGYKELISLLSGYSWIERIDDDWRLTDLGKEIGGVYKTSSKRENYIAWPESIVSSLGLEDESATGNNEEALLSATGLGARLHITAQRMNKILSELGWIEKGLKGWLLTKQGIKVGGVQKEHPKTGIPYVNWPDSVLENPNFSTLVRELEEGSSNRVDESKSANETDPTGFRDKFEAKLRTTDGHYVRSKAEMLIDNWLYMAELVHAYERKLPVEEELYSDFYIPAGKVYIEYWGYESDPKYLARKERKREIYAKYGFKLIELEDKDIQNLDDVLPRLLLKHGVETF